jgi:hypothetical protein
VWRNRARWDTSIAEDLVGVLDVGADQLVDCAGKCCKARDNYARRGCFVSLCVYFGSGVLTRSKEKGGKLWAL